MFEIFPNHPAYEYPELINVSYSLVWAFLLASIIAITHKLTFTGEYYPKNFFQALMLGSIVTAMVMMAVGDSLARGLGVFGAMAIIRFRTRIDDPRNVLFLFAALSCGLAVGVYGYTISFTGTLIFCAGAFILHYSPFRSFALSSIVSFTLDDVNELPAAVKHVEDNCVDFKAIGISYTEEKKTRYQYSVAFHKDGDKNKLIEDLKTIPGISLIRITINETQVNDY